VIVRIALIVAMAENGVIGRGQKLPWHLPDDLQHFKALTIGKPILMGRRTFASIGRALPGRRNLVLSRAERAPVSGVEVVHSLDEVIERCGNAPELCVIGGADIYALTLPRATHIYLTRVHASIEGDVRFPRLDPGEWRETARSEHMVDARHEYAMSFITLERTAGTAA
jgi:dihydrofolate reductase